MENSPHKETFFLTPLFTFIMPQGMKGYSLFKTLGVVCVCFVSPDSSKNLVPYLTLSIWVVSMKSM